MKRVYVLLSFAQVIDMWLLLALILLLVWGGSFFAFHVTGFLIHILIVFAVISLIMNFVSGRRA